ncbi:MAG: hypothetical protein CVU24_03275 [Betaproteobacteria bacterium HGW-Betaproteobacteria-18]|nr:MAG: hypothetical protein CVU24_03275 [Betaproteobacteria bacterium HGW-Betaproteobacteria-18]
MSNIRKQSLTKKPPQRSTEVKLSVVNDKTSSLESHFYPVLKGVKLDAALKKSIPKANAVLPSLLHEGQQAFIRVASGIYPQMYGVIISMAVAAGKHLSPYGKAERGQVLLAYSGATEARVLEQLSLVSDLIKDDARREAAKKNLDLYKFDLGIKNEGALSNADGRSMFDGAIPPDCKLVVFFDVARCLSRRTCEPEHFVQLADVLNDLNRHGIATLVFYQAGKKSDAAFESELLANSNGYTLELTEDRGAPREFGTGFNVHRRKTSEHDTVPTVFQVWYTVVDGELKFGWECRDPNDKTNAKQVEIAERQKRVQNLIDSGMQQKDIAAELGVNSATISRDATTLKSKAKSTAKPRVKKGNSAD